jgi:hypothetical protein
LAKVKSLPRPLSAFIFSRDQATIDRFLGELSFGGGAVNQVNIHLFIGTMPFGGGWLVGDWTLLRQNTDSSPLPTQNPYSFHRRMLPLSIFCRHTPPGNSRSWRDGRSTR